MTLWRSKTEVEKTAVKAAPELLPHLKKLPLFFGNWKFPASKNILKN